MTDHSFIPDTNRAVIQMLPVFTCLLFGSPLYVKINNFLFVYQDHFSARLVTGNTGEVYARTGYLGFLRRTEAIGSDGGMLSYPVL